ncbi:hypothetical protein NUSPORA_00640 [Nucleospora cyclopteri]
MIDKDFLEYLKKKYKVEEEKDGSFSVGVGTDTYIISNKVNSTNKEFGLNYPSKREIEEKSNKNIFRKEKKPGIGSDDLDPFSSSHELKPHEKTRGMFASFSDFDHQKDPETSGDDFNPFIKKDPVVPSRKKKSQEPDPDNANPSRMPDYFRDI